MSNMNFRTAKNNFNSLTLNGQSNQIARRLLTILILLSGFLITLPSNASANAEPHSTQLSAAAGNILRVGPGRTYSRVSDAAAAAQDGDVIEIDAGTYTGNAAVAVWTANNLIVRGVGNGRASLVANGAYVWGKGIFVAAGNNITFENIEFSGAAVPSNNGAGIRLDGSSLTVRNCYFHDNENGILTASGSESDVLIEYSEFARNGQGAGCDTTGCTHNMYINQVRSFTLRGSYSHSARRGHEIKSRALKNLILYNRLSDESDGTASYVVNLPNGGDSYLIGNVIQKGANSENRSALITFGEDNLNASQIQQLTLANNTIVDDKGAYNFVRFDKTPSAATFVNNIFVGGGTISTYPGTIFRNNLINQDPGFVNRAGYDYHLTSGSPAIDAGTNPGTINNVNLTPALQYLHPAATEIRTASGLAIDIGAFEFAGAPPPNNIPPSVNIVAPANNTVFGASANIDVSAVAADADGTVAKVEFYAGAVKLGEDATVPYSFTWTNTSAGNYVLTARAIDNAGAATTSAAVNITVATEPAGTVPNGTYKITAKHSGKALDVTDASQSNGAVIQQYDYVGGNNQQWVIEALADNTYKITALHSGKALDVCGVSYADGACLIQYDFHGGDNQRWRIEPVGGGFYRIIAKHSGKALDVAEASVQNNGRVHQWTYYGIDNQLWRLDALPLSD